MGLLFSLLEYATSRKAEFHVCFTLAYKQCDIFIILEQI